MVGGKERICPTSLYGIPVSDHPISSPPTAEFLY